jgi:MFS family permease
MLHLGLARAPLHIALATLLLGFLSELPRPAMLALVADVVPPEDQTRAYGLLYWAANLGFAVAALVAGALATRSFAALFVVDALTTLAMAAILWLRVPETRPVRDGAGARPSAIELLAPYRDGVFVVFVLLGLLVSMLFFQSFVGLPLDMRRHGLAPSAYGSLIAINGVLIVALQPTALTLVARFRRAHVLALGAALTAIGFGLTALARTPHAYALSIVIWTLGEIVLSPVTPTVVADLAPSSLRGSYQGAFQLSWGAASLLSPALGALVLGRWGASALWGGCLALGLVAAAGQLAAAPARRRRLASLRAAGPVAADAN